jgi:putative ABC transport system permease protein
MLALFRTVSLRYLRLRWPLNSLVILSIGLGVSIWVATSALYQSLEHSVLSSVNPMTGLADLQISKGDTGVPLALQEPLARIDGIQSARPFISESSVQVFLADGTHRAVIVGIDPQGNDTSAEIGDVKVSEGTFARYIAVAAARLLPPTLRPTEYAKVGQPVIVGQGLDAMLPAGDNLTFDVLAGGQRKQVTRVGTLDASGPIAVLGGNVLLMRVADAAQLVGRPDRASRFDIVLTPEANRETVMADIRTTLDKYGGGEVQTPEVNDNRVRELLAPLKAGALIVSAGALVVGMFLVYNTLSVNVAERRHDIGVLRSLGATRDQVRRLFQSEALLLGLLGSLIGIPLGLVLAHLLLGPAGRIVLESLGTVPMRVPALADLWSVLLSAIAAGMATSVAASLVPAMRAASEEPADAVRRVPRSARLSARVAQLTACLILAGLGVAVMAGRDHLPSKRAAMFAGVGFIFLAAFLAIALFSAVCSRLLRPVAQLLFPIEGRLASDNLVRAAGRTGLVIAALAACVALMAHTAGIIRSNEITVMSWLDRALTADLVVTSGGPVSATGQTLEMSQKVADEIVAQFPGARGVAISWRTPTSEEFGPVTLAAVDMDGYATANEERHAPMPHLPLLRRLVKEKGTVIVSENFAYLHHVQPGDTVTLKGTDGPVPLKIIGAVEDCSSPLGLVLMHREHFARELDTTKIDILDVYLPAGTSRVEVERARDALARSELAGRYSLVLLTGAEVRDNIRDVIRRIYSMAYLQEIVVGVVAGLGVVAALLISVIQRRRELGLLRAVGASQGQVMRSVLFEALLMAVIGSVLGLLFGLLLEWYAVDVILLEESGFHLPVTIPWREAAIISLLAMATATVAGLLPALRAVRLRIADAIAYE